MRNQLKLLLVLGLLALMLPLMFNYIIGPVGAANTAIVKDHQDSGSKSEAFCQGCHMADGIDPNDAIYPGAHKKHYVTAFLDFADCGECHEESVFGGGVGEGMGSGYEGDLSYADAETTTTPASYVRSANKGVKADVCELCHRSFSIDTVAHTGLNADTDAINCQAGTCHDGTGGTGDTPATAHNAGTYINQDYANSKTYCGKCHGGQAWYETTATPGSLQ